MKIAVHDLFIVVGILTAAVGGYAIHPGLGLLAPGVMLFVLGAFYTPTRP